MKFSKSGNEAITLIAVCLSGVLFYLEVSSVPVILPTLEKVLHGNFSDMQWIMNAYTIACTTVLMATGALADRYGRKRIFIISLLLFSLTSLICGFSKDISLLIISRTLQGIGGGAMTICQIAVLSHQFQKGQERSRAFALWGLVLGIGLGFGPLIGGTIVAILTWKWIFWVHTPLALLAALLVSLGVEESNDLKPGNLDIAGIATLSLSVLGLTYFITQGPAIGFSSNMAVTAIAGAAISFIIFLFVEKNHSNPMFDFSVFRIRNLSGAVIGAIAMNFSFWPFNIYLPVYFQGVLGYSVGTSGICILMYTLPTLLIPPLAERLSYKYQPCKVIPAGLFTIGVGFFLINYGSSLTPSSWLTVLPGCLIAGIGLGLTNTPVTNTITGSVPASKAGMASGIDMSARLVTFAINIAFMGFILLEGTLAYLKKHVPFVDNLQLRSVAEKVVTGNVVTHGQQSLDMSGMPLQAALLHGFNSVLLYGGWGVWGLAFVSAMIFGFKKVN